MELIQCRLTARKIKQIVEKGIQVACYWRGNIYRGIQSEGHRF